MAETIVYEACLSAGFLIGNRRACCCFVGLILKCTICTGRLPHLQKGGSPLNRFNLTNKITEQLSGETLLSHRMNGFFEASLLNWLLVALAAFVIGFSKAGIKGIEVMNVTIMAIVFGSKASTGIVLPLLCVADVMAVWWYHRHARWEHFRRLLPWIAVGIFAGVFVGSAVDEPVFRRIMAVIIVLTVAMILLVELRKSISVPHAKSFAAVMGLTAGFTTMLGNLAGPFSNVYFLGMRLPKNDFIGTAAWLFLCINFFKLPLQVIFWKNITPASLWLDLLLLPAMFAGFFAGIRLVAKIRDDRYRKVVIVLTLIGAVFIFLK